MNGMVVKLEMARRYTEKYPPAISDQGGHNVTFRLAAILVWGFALDETEAMMLLREWNQKCQPPWSEKELRHKILDAAAAEHRHPRGYLLGNGYRYQGFRPSSYPLLQKKATPLLVNSVAAAEAFLKGFRCGEADLFDASQIRPPDDPRFDGAVLVEALYGSGELINFVTKYKVETEKSGRVKAGPIGHGITVERDALVARFLASGSDNDKGGAWLRMNPLDGDGITDENVTKFRFSLLEIDTIPLELQLSLFARLPLPVAAIIASGGRSVHAWVKVDATHFDEYRSKVARMLELLARFGVDGKNKNPSRLSRLPGARREIGATGDGMQRLLYLNPSPGERPII